MKCPSQLRSAAKTYRKGRSRAGTETGAGATSNVRLIGFGPAPVPGAKSNLGEAGVPVHHVDDPRIRPSAPVGRLPERVASDRTCAKTQSAGPSRLPGRVRD